MSTQHVERKRESGEQEIAKLKARLAEAEETLRAIRSGEVDALVVNGPDGDQIFTLQGGETSYRFLIEEMNEGALLLAPDGTILYANKSFAQLVGRPLGQVISRSWYEFFPAEEGARLHALLGTAKQAGVRQEFLLQREKEPRMPVDVSVASLSREHIQGFSVIVTDLTQRKAQEEALKRSFAEMEAFSYSLSHDMRAPVRAIQSFAQIVWEESQAKLDSDALHMLERVIHSAHRMDSLIQDVLALSRVSRQEVVIEPVDVDQLVRELIEERPEFQAPRAEIKIVGRLLPMRAHRASLTQCLTNLLSNAVKFVPAGAKPKIRICTEERPCPVSPASPANEECVRLWVEDNGIGIEPHAHNRIFEMFTRLHRNYEGTGIGLAIVRRAVERMGGTLGVESQPGKGSRFWIELGKA